VLRQDLIFTSELEVELYRTVQNDVGHNTAWILQRELRAEEVLRNREGDRNETWV
jgi:hypothetical protein